MNAERARRPNLMAALKDAAVVIAALLADPFDRAARMEARTWLTAWMQAETNGAAKGGR